MNNEEEFKRFIKEWQSGQPHHTVSPCGSENWEVKILLDTKRINNFSVDPSMNLSGINSLPSKQVIEKLKCIYHCVSSKGAKKLTPHLLKVKHNLLGNPNASFGQKRVVLKNSKGVNKGVLWFDELDTYIDGLRSITFTFVQYEVNNNPLIKHALLMIDVKVNP